MKSIKILALLLVLSLSLCSVVLANFGNEGHNKGRDPLINSINPESGHPWQILTVTISGQNTNFSQGTNMVWFEQGTSAIQAYNINSVNDTILNATFDLPYSPLGYYDVNCYSSYNGLLQPLENGFLLEFPTINSINPESGNPGQTLMVTISGQNTHFTQGTNMIWFEQGSSTIQAYNVNSVNDTILDATFNLPYYPLGYYDVSGSNYYDGTFIPLENGFLLNEFQTYYLETGFQFISSRLIPENPDMLIVMADVLNNNLSFARNSQGQTLRKIGPNWVNGIGDWLVDEGYLVKMNADDSFSISGDAIDPSTPIPVEAGFQFVSYLPTIPMDALIAFETIIGDNLEFIRNSQGQTLRKIGPNWVNGLGDCQPGEGYLVKMYADGILIYPDSSFTCGDPFNDQRDNQIYESVQIGDQCWMAENLNIGEMINGTNDQTDNEIIEKYCYNNNSTNCDEYGGLYKWDEMMQYVTDSLTQGICPDGWHIPADYEWISLKNFLGGWGPAGVKMKETGTVHWRPPNTSATNESGFTALPSGHFAPLNSFENLTYEGEFWSTSEHIITSQAWFWFLSYNYNILLRYVKYKFYGISVRCLQDNSATHTGGRSPFDNLSIKDNNRTYNWSDPKTKYIEPIHFLFEGGNPAEEVYTLYLEGLEIGDEVAAYDGEKLIGAVKINSENAFENELPVFSTLVSGQGYESGNPITLKVWSENKFLSADFTMETIYDSYVSDVYPEGDGKYSVVNITKGEIENIEEIISVYPNPSTGKITIEKLSGFGNLTGLEITDITGKTVFHSNDTELARMGIINQESKMIIDLSMLEKGVYFLSFNGKDFKEVKKIVIK